MAPTKYADRSIPKISLHDFSNRIDEITTQLIHAAETDGFFCLIDHGIPSSSIDKIFATSESFFSLLDSTKTNVQFDAIKNAGWEKKSQIRPSTGVADQKDSYQMQFGSNMDGMWLSDSDLPCFKETSLAFMKQAQEVSEKLMLCFARGLGLSDDYFITAHDVLRNNAQTVLRFLHYFEVDKSARFQKVTTVLALTQTGISSPSSSKKGAKAASRFAPEERLSPASVRRRYMEES
ncbi:unnamed protein product [Calypogeia fissa]